MPGDFRHPRDATTPSTFPQALDSHGPRFKICFCESQKLYVIFKGLLHRHDGVCAVNVAESPRNYEVNTKLSDK